MSIISSVADLFRVANAIPSIEASLARGLGFSQIVQNLRTRLPQDAVVSSQVLSAAIQRVRAASNTGAALTSGQSLDPRLYQIDPTLRPGTEYRYRIAVNINVPSITDPSGFQTVRTVIPVDSPVPLTALEIQRMVSPAIELLARVDPSPTIRNAATGLSIPQSTVEDVRIISAYRQSTR